MGIVLCGGDFTCRPDTESDCPDRDQHTPMPSGYVDRAEWAASMLAHGASNYRCPTCGLYAMWTPPAAPFRRTSDDPQGERLGRVPRVRYGRGRRAAAGAGRGGLSGD